MLGLENEQPIKVLYFITFISWLVGVGGSAHSHKATSPPDAEPEALYGV